MIKTKSNINLSHHQQISTALLLAILGALMAITSLSTDIYLPAMPAMHAELQGDIELTITGFLIGFAIGQIMWGPISDKYGRKLPLMIGLVLFVLGSIGCALSQNINQIMCFRVIQALGACTGPMISRAIIRDLYERSKAAEMLSTLMLVMAIAPIVGPLLGGQMLQFSSWHSIFWLLAVIGFVMLLATHLLPETLPTGRPDVSLSATFAKYKLLIRHKTFMRYTLCVAFFYIGAYAFIAGSPFVYISYFGIDAQYYGFLFALNVVGIMLLSVLNRQLVRRHSLNKLLKIATTIAMTAAVLLALFVYNNWGGVYAVVFFVFCFFSMNGIIAATATAAALDDVADMAGAASALLGALQYGSGIVSTILLTTFANGTPWTMSWIIALAGILSASTVLFNWQK